MRLLYSGDVSRRRRGSCRQRVIADNRCDCDKAEIILGGIEYELIGDYEKRTKDGEESQRIAEREKEEIHHHIPHEDNTIEVKGLCMSQEITGCHQEGLDGAGIVECDLRDPEDRDGEGCHNEDDAYNKKDGGEEYPQEECEGRLLFPCNRNNRCNPASKEAEDKGDDDKDQPHQCCETEEGEKKPPALIEKFLRLEAC